MLKDADQENSPFPASIANISLTGMCLSIGQPIPEGTIIRVRRPTAPAEVPWAEVQVKRLEAKDNAWEIGCEFTSPLTWDLIMQFR
jgi:hypothetical protein